MQVLGLEYVDDAATSVEAILGKLGSGSRAGDRRESA
jgi:hypothetical protein